MWWSYPNGFKTTNTAQAWLWDPVTGTSNRVDPPLWRDPADGQLKPANIWCSGQVLLADGRVLVTGGNLAYTGGTPNFRGLNKVYTFNPFNETWTEQPDMPHGRWYPSQKLLPDGRVLVMGGYNENGQGSNNLDIEVFTPSADMNGVGTMTKVGTRGGTGNPPDGELYPHMFVMPSGRTLVAGPSPEDSWFFNTIGPSAFTWAEIPNPPNSRLWGAAVHTPAGPAGSTKVTLTGGKNWSSGPVQSTTTVYDEAAPGLGWQGGPSMNVARAHHNTVLLPDGGMATFGGGVGKRTPEGLWAADPEHRQVDLLDPGGGTWRTGASQVKARAYHSTAVLLPDGRVISAGSEDYYATAGADTAEIYEPPYLFRGTRPGIASAPGSVNWGDEFGIESGSDVSRATLVAPAAVTHANDMNQRHVELEVTEDLAGRGLNVKAPPNNRVAQPGYYMLFLLNGDGVPSVAKWIRLDAAAPDRPRIDPGPPPQRTLTVSTAGSGTGRVTGSGIDCPGDCTQDYPDGTPVTLSASATGGSSFAGWGGGACSGTGDCQLTMSADKAVSASFAPPDTSPTAVADAATVAEDSAAAAIGVLTNDTDPDGGPKLIGSASDPAHGTTAVTGGGSGLTYAPDANYCGPDSFTYALNGGSAATVSVTVSCVDDPPVAVSDTVTRTEDSAAAAIAVLSNDTDIDGGPKTISSASDPAHGTTVVTGGGSGLTYAPDSNYCGSDSFTYALNGGSTATVSVTISCVDDPPVAVSDTVTRAEDSAAAAVAVLANDTDVDGGPKTISSASDPGHGTTVVTGGGSGLTYAPDPNYCGADSFTYTLNGGSSATVSVTVTCNDDMPAAVDDAATVIEDSAAAPIGVLANDTDSDGGPKTISSASDPGHGTTVVTGGGSSLTYAPDPNYCGADSFTYTLNGGSSATVSVAVSCVDDGPTAVADSATVAEDSAAAAINVLANDTDADGGSTAISSASDPAHGTAGVTGGGSGLIYAPDAGYCGPDSFTYTLNGGSTATVSVTVSCDDDGPTAVADSAAVTEDSGARTIDVLANDTDPDGGGRTVVFTSDPGHGTAAIAIGGLSVTYAPDANYCGPDSFSYSLNGGSTAIVSITVSCVDDGPTAVTDSAAVIEDSGMNAISVLSNDTDVDGGPKSIASASDPAHGATAVTGGGSGLTYAPDASYCGPDSFTYSLNGGSAATVSIGVSCVDDPPLALNDAKTVAQNTGATTVDVLANDPDPDGGPKVIVSASDAPRGTVAVAAGGSSLTYRPDRDYCGADSFTYTLNGGSSAAVAITVRRKNRKCATATGAGSKRSKRLSRRSRTG